MQVWPEGGLPQVRLQDQAGLPRPLRRGGRPRQQGPAQARGGQQLRLIWEEVPVDCQARANPSPSHPPAAQTLPERAEEGGGAERAGHLPNPDPDQLQEEVHGPQEGRHGPEEGRSLGPQEGRGIGPSTINRQFFSSIGLASV